MTCIVTRTGNGQNYEKKWNVKYVMLIKDKLMAK